MAHAGNPTDLAQQPATSTSNGLWQALLAVIVMLAIGAGMVYVGTNLASSTRVAAPLVDHRLDGIEAQHGAAALPGANTVSDGSYTQVEGIRGNAFSAPSKVSGTAPDNGPGRIQGHRGAIEFE